MCFWTMWYMYRQSTGFYNHGNGRKKPVMIAKLTPRDTLVQ